jgi:P4 family phage/plasmid primase-like protien
MNNLFKEFGRNQKADAFEYATLHKLSVWQRDLNDSGAKILFVDSYENVFNKIKSGRNNIYEYWSSVANVRFFIDYDRKVEIQDPNDLKKRSDNLDVQNTHKTDILNIINTVRTLIPNIKATYILKSIPAVTKKSYHITFDGIHFPNRSVLKKFVEDQLKPKFKILFDKKIIDIKVYGDLCFRTLLSTKSGQNRPLYLLNTENFINELQENPYSVEHTTYDQFLKTCISYIDNDSFRYDYRSEKKKNNNKKVHLMTEEDIYSDKEVVRKYLDLLDGDRYTDYNKWLNIGFILFSINSDYIDLWHYFSSKWEHYDEDLCNTKWNTFANSEYIYTINNLIFLAKVDNPDDSEELSKDIPNHDLCYLRAFDNVLSKFIHRIYGENFVCSDPKNDEWYYFNSIRWKKENKSFNLRKKITNEIFNKIEIYRKQLVKEGASDDIIRNYHGILQKLGSGIKLNCLEIEFYNENFYKIIDQNKDLIGFENGIYDLNLMEFRTGVSSDYVSMSTGYDFHQHTSDEPIYQELLTLISQILPEPETRHFTLKSISSCLDGHTRDENFYIWSGKNASGGNGKSTITELLTKALGEYAIDSPVSLITGKRESSNNPNSALVSIRNKRAVIMQEPGSNDQIQADVMKSLTGGDRISTRELHGKQVEFKPNAKIFMACNRIPTMSDIDGGVSRRIKITEFVSKFIDNPSKEMHQGIFEFKIDKELKSKLESYKTVFLCILLDYYKIYKAEGLVPPDSVAAVTQKYENSNNYMKAFVEENIIKGTRTDFITKDEIKAIYRSDIFLQRNFPKLSTLLTELENSLCSEFKLDARRHTYRLDGYRIKNNDIDDDDDNTFNDEL